MKEEGWQNSVDGIRVAGIRVAEALEVLSRWGYVIVFMLLKDDSACYAENPL